ncbi:MAG: tRNA 4-thiouridine(8) synthase ThiI [Oscillospiraceae bacterium]|nr:tRNA 4-thiouridine(8) synthase ThiI [Oscillospiraceae bacterium]
MEILLLKMGEIVLKGLNRRAFENKLLSSVASCVARYGEFSVESRQSTIYVRAKDHSCDMTGAFEEAGKVFGIAALSIAIQCEQSLDALRREIPRLTRLNRVKTFKAEARRANKSFPLTSPQICAELGQAILEEFPHLKVDVKTPEEIVWAEIRENHAYLHLKASPGAGGLPAGTAGRAVLLLSGGIDSPVAGWRMARRGIELMPVHFYSYPYTSPEAKDKVIKLAELLSVWTGQLTLRVVSFTAIQEQIRKKAPEDVFTLLMRRSMMRISAKIAENTQSGALITGDSLGQVASQTLEAISVADAASPIPVFRPLIGEDKEETVTTSRKIGTYETSILPHEDCCSVFTPRHPKTKPRLEKIEHFESNCELEGLEKTAVYDVECVKIPKQD